LKHIRSRDGVTVLLTTHLTEEAAECDWLAFLDQGRIVASGTPEQLTAEIGGDIISVRTREPDILSAEIFRRFGLQALLMNGELRIECGEGHQFIPKLVEAFPGRIQGISLGKPTLEDVFTPSWPPSLFQWSL
jgi:ABC-2 type transport system ATP-binding protein